MKYIRHIKIDITPMNFMGQDQAVLHRLSVCVTSNTDQYQQDIVITEDDFTSRFDWIFERCLRILKEQFNRSPPEGKP
jgi:hypothetical protein